MVFHHNSKEAFHLLLFTPDAGPKQLLTTIPKEIVTFVYPTFFSKLQADYQHSHQEVARLFSDLGTRLLDYDKHYGLVRPFFYPDYLLLNNQVNEAVLKQVMTEKEGFITEIGTHLSSETNSIQFFVTTLKYFQVRRYNKPYFAEISKTIAVTEVERALATDRMKSEYVQRWCKLNTALRIKSDEHDFLVLLNKESHPNMVFVVSTDF